MEKINCLVVDDESMGRKLLEENVRQIPFLNLVGSCKNAFDAMEKLQENSVDLIFLDIQMPGKTGFDLLAEIDKAPRVIFTTAYDEYAIKAFEVNALDYLLKPIEPKRLNDAIQKLHYEIQKEQANAQNGRGLLTEDDQVFVKDGEKCWFVKLHEIRLFESVGNYAKVFFGTNKPLILKSLNALEERLDERNFFRANRKHIINLRWIEKIEPYFNGGLLIELKGGEKIEVSRRQTVKFKEMMSL
jgi:two-component system LytT family response regulator